MEPAKVVGASRIAECRISQERRLAWHYPLTGAQCGPNTLGLPDRAVRAFTDAGYLTGGASGPGRSILAPWRLGGVAYEAGPKVFGEGLGEYRLCAEVEGAMVSNRVYITEDFVFAPRGATVGDVLSAYVMRGAHYWWWLVTAVDAEYRICSYGSMLPYLVGLTSHIVHKPGACPICSTLDPMLWRNTETLIAKALADPDVRSRRVSDLPMKPLAIADVAHIDEPDLFLQLIAQDKGTSIYGVVEDGVFIGVNSEQTRTMGGVGGAPTLPGF